MFYVMVYITAGSHDEALTLGRMLVEARLAACANVLGTITSIYWWEGKVEQGNEVALIVKTKESLVEQVIAKVKEQHSYECPCVVALPIEAGNPAFLKWIGNETL